MPRNLILEPIKEVPARSSDINNVDLRLDKIPVELYPAVNRIALELANTLGWECPANLDFVNSKNLRAIKMTHLALVAMGELQDFCMDEWGTSLNDLVDEE